MAVAVQERVWKAEPDQATFLRHENVDEILFGGRKGSGKTDGLLIFNAMRRKRYPGSSGLILRKNLADTQKEHGVIPRSKELFTGLGIYNESRHKWVLTDGGVIELGYLQRDADVYNYQGAGYDDICITQAEQLTGWQITVLTGALRTTRKDLKPVLRLDANPGGRGHAYLKAGFVDPAPPGTVFTDPKTGRTRMYIAARTIPHINPEYQKWLDNLPEPLRSAWRDGKWDAFGGQYFSEWNSAVHTCTPFPIPEAWPKWMAYDWGSASPAWFGWFTRAPWGTIYLYHEQYIAREDESGRWVGLGKTVDTMVREAGEQTLADGRRAGLQPPCYAGPDMFTRSGQTGETNADVASREGLGMELAMTDRIQGWQRIKRALQIRDIDHSGVTVAEPELLIFNHCRHIIRTLPQMVSDERNPEDIEDGQEDHAPDGLRYGLASVPSTIGAAPMEFILGEEMRSAQVDWGDRDR